MPNQSKDIEQTTIKNSLDFIKVFVIYNYPFEIPQSNAKLLF